MLLLLTHILLRYYLRLLNSNSLLLEWILRSLILSCLILLLGKLFLLIARLLEDSIIRIWIILLVLIKLIWLLSLYLVKIWIIQIQRLLRKWIYRCIGKLILVIPRIKLWLLRLVLINIYLLSKWLVVLIWLICIWWISQSTSILLVCLTLHILRRKIYWLLRLRSLALMANCQKFLVRKIVFSTKILTKLCYFWVLRINNFAILFHLRINHIIIR